jgi:hypothetical protein
MRECMLQWKKVYPNMHNKPSQEVLLPAEAFLFELARKKQLLSAHE